MAMSRNGFNRASTRALIKAARCIDRSSKIPGQIRAHLDGLKPNMLRSLAERHGKTITADGCVRLNPCAPDPDIGREAADV